MTPRKDDMVIVPRFGKPKLTTSPRERAHQDRLTDRVRKRRKSLRRRLRRARVLRGDPRGLLSKGRLLALGRKVTQSPGIVESVGGAAGRSAGFFLAAKAAKRAGRKAAGSFIWTGVKWIFRTGSKAIPYVGWAWAAVDAVLIAHQISRQIDEGKSSRLVNLEDRMAMFRGLDLEAAANDAGLAYLEGDAAALRSIGRAGRVSSSLLSNANFIKQRRWEELKGGREIERDKDFDSADTFIDRLIKTWWTADVQHEVDTSIGKIRAAGFGRVRSTR